MHEIQKFVIANVAKHPTDIVKVAESKFKVSKTAVFKHIKKLKELGIITQEGSRNKTTYFLSKAPQAKNEKGQEERLDFEVGEYDEDEIWRMFIKDRLGQLSLNILEICKYGFTEMFNNVIDHSKSKKATVKILNSEAQIKISIMDFGIGVFKNIAAHFQIHDLREAVIRLHQGKVTTDKTRHTGQGIFFTSRAFDRFYLAANGYAYIKDNSKTDEWYWESQDEVDKEVGTCITMEIDKVSSRVLKDVFDKYTSDDLSFDKSHIRIELGKYEEDSYVSRSQAKRLLAGLGKFRTIFFDFKNIRNVGQGFVDEVFGVFGLEHTDIHFRIINANDDIKFMIKRGLKDREIPQSRITME
jgi:anti-sigma regulatory factor (Ser/Thr protein kinase)/biotin operon repressor